MTTKLTVKRFRTRRVDLPAAAPAAAPAQAAAAPLPPPRSVSRPQINPKTGPSDDAFAAAANEDGFGADRFDTARLNAAPSGPMAPPGSPEAAPLVIDAIRREGLTGRQLRMARRLAQKHALPATSDFDAVRLLRARGIDPFQANSVLELVSGADGSGQTPSRALTVTPGGDGIQLPQTIKPVQLPSTELRTEQAHLAEVMKIQRDIARRRRRKSLLLMARLSVFVLLPALLAGLYFYSIATPMYAARTQFVIQQAEAPGASAMGGLFSSTPMATAQDSIAVQGYLQSQVAMQRLEADNAFRGHFSDPGIDVIQRLSPDASESATYKLYKKIVRIAYDPTEGVVKMEIIAADPQKAVEFSNALIGYAEEQVDQMTQRLREDQMKGARESYEDAERKYQEANVRVVELQEKFKVLSSEAEVGLITSQIGQLETQLTQDQLSLAQMESNQNPNKARMEPLKRRIDTLQTQIAELRARLTEEGKDGFSLAQVQSDLLVAQADAQTRQLLLAQSLQAMETARVEANRQTRYLSVAVAPVAPDEAAYPRAFENTLVVLLIFAGIYLMVSMTVAILREQVSA
ncbi:capsule biosynthesis protein [Tabrizicola oligotrophica]|uniref:Capsule biosynthesis protein n=1 Tax=Tabrizicola oligotrophica TaxID=2710650 RepID=A0A6M0QNU0_9RHOB|nr:capsule biosynthesis protein [Tabrizicola oligotrophica]NEY89069.1 capsule biosynthesis protein [Tabrizicola oligotrophica]